MDGSLQETAAEYSIFKCLSSICWSYVESPCECWICVDRQGFPENFIFTYITSHAKKDAGLFAGIIRMYLTSGVHCYCERLRENLSSFLPMTHKLNETLPGESPVTKFH